MNPLWCTTWTRWDQTQRAKVMSLKRWNGHCSVWKAGASRANAAWDMTSPDAPLEVPTNESAGRQAGRQAGIRMHGRQICRDGTAGSRRAGGAERTHRRREAAQRGKGHPM